MPSGSEESTLSVYNVQGILVGQDKLSSNNGSISLSAAGLPAGLYLLKANNGGKKAATYKLIVE